MKFHPAADIFPLLEGSEFEELVADIKKNGVIDNVIIHEDQILDGRNRFRAAAAAGVSCPMVPWEGQCGDPVSFVISQNIKRRQMTPSQRAMCAEKAREMFDRAAKERMLKGKKPDPKESLPEGRGQSRDQAGRAFAVSGKLVDQARTVREHGTPELVKSVEEGRMSVTTAAILAREPEDVQREEIANPLRNRTYKSLAIPIESSSEGTKDVQPVSPITGKAITLANEAINCLMRIPKNDPQRKRGFQIVTDWIRLNK